MPLLPDQDSTADPCSDRMDDELAAALVIALAESLEQQACRGVTDRRP